MNIRLIAFQGQRLSHTGLLIELWFHVLVCAVDQQPSTASLVHLRMVLAHCAHQIKRGEDLDLDSLLAQPEQLPELLALGHVVVDTLPSEPLARIPPIFLSSITPQGGFWRSDYATFDFESRRLQLFGQSFLHLLRGTLPPPPGTHQAWRSCREDVRTRTHQLRTSTEAIWFRLRYLLHSEGFAPQHVWVAEFHAEDAAMFCGIIVTRERYVYMFDFAYRDVSILEGWLSAWWDITDDWHRLAYRTAITIALTGIAEEEVAI